MTTEIVMPEQQKTEQEWAATAWDGEGPKPTYDEYRMHLLFDGYMDARNRGETPDVPALLSQCPAECAGPLADAIDGFECTDAPPLTEATRPPPSQSAGRP